MNGPACDTLAKRIRCVRKWRGWKASELARAVGVCEAAIWHWEKGSHEPLFGNVHHMAVWLGVPLASYDVWEPCPSCGGRKTGDVVLSID